MEKVNTPEIIDIRTVLQDAADIEEELESGKSDDIETLASTEEDEEVIYNVGQHFKVRKANLYYSATNDNVANTISGEYYLWEDNVTNGRIRITNRAENAGKAGCITGWIDVDDILDIDAPLDLHNGAKLYLDDIRIYNSSYAINISGRKTGNFYVFESTVLNGRIRMVEEEKNVNVPGMCDFWVNVIDIKEQ